MIFKRKILNLGLSFIYFLSFESQAMEFDSSPEGQISETKKRPHTPIESQKSISPQSLPPKGGRLVNACKAN